MRISILLAGAVLAALSHLPSAEAAGIDCATAKEAHDKAICADPTLHQLDQDLAAAYERLASAASAAGSAHVQRDAHDRHAFIEELCVPADAGCLASAYRQGLASVTKFAAQPPGGILVPVERFRLLPDKTSVLMAFPRLDSPAQPWADAFEKAARETAEGLQPDDADIDAVIDYRPTYLAPDLAAVAFSVWNFPHGAAHGLGHQVAFDYLPAQQRRLLPSDLFESGTTWSSFLAERAFEGLQEQAKSGGWELAVSGPGELEKAIADPATWLIHPNGLGLYFEPDSVGAYVTGEREVLVPWPDLQPYLATTPAFKIPGN